VLLLTPGAAESPAVAAAAPEAALMPLLLLVVPLLPVLAKQPLLPGPLNLLAVRVRRWFSYLDGQQQQ